jgi:hypothetical protein
MPKSNAKLVPNLKGNKIRKDPPTIPNILPKANPIGPSGFL